MATKENLMNLETYKINIRAYFPDVMFIESDGIVECLSTDGDWLHTLYWKDGDAYFAVSDTVLSEKSLVTYLKKAAETQAKAELADNVPAHIVKQYKSRIIGLLNTVCDDYCKGAKQ